MHLPFLLLIATLLPSFCRPSPCACKDRAKIRVALVLHGDADTSIPFSNLKQGFLEASKSVRISPSTYLVSPEELVNVYQGDANAALLDKLDQAETDGVDAIVTAVPKLDAVKGKLSALMDAGIPVFTVDVGFYELLSVGETNLNYVNAHLGSDERLTGFRAGEKMGRSGGQHALCLLTANPTDDRSSFHRCEGFKDGFESICQGVDCKASVVQVDGGNIEATARTIQALLDGDASINAVVAPTGKTALRAHDLLGGNNRTSTSDSRVHLVGSFIVDPQVEDMMGASKLLFAVNNEQYVNAFLATTLASYYLSTGQLPYTRLIQTGPRFITETKVASSARIDQVKIEMIVHGRGVDGFWHDFQIGVREAARDMGVAYHDCTLSGVTGVGREADDDAKSVCSDSTSTGVVYRAPGSEFDLTAMSKLIEDAAASAPDGMLVSIPNANALRDAINTAVKTHKIDTMSVNAGGDVFEELGVLMHFGQNEESAGYEAGRKLAQEGATKVICLNHETGNEALDQRCTGVQRGLEAELGAGSHIIKVEVSFANAATFKSALTLAYDNNPDVDGIMLLGPSSIESASSFLDDTGRLGATVVGTFDVLPETIEALRQEKVDFAIHQQQQMQAYLPTIAMVLRATTGSLLNEKLFATGPAIVTNATASQLQCQSVPTCPLSNPEADAVCERPEWASDGWCDPVNNHAGCNFDGGDCCAGVVSDKPSCESGEDFSCGVDSFGNGLNRFQCVDPLYVCLEANDPTNDLCLDATQRLSDAEGTAVVVFASFGIALAFFFAGGFFLYRKSRVVFFANLKLMSGVLTGLTLVAFQSVLVTMAQSLGVCRARMVLFNMGSSLAFACVLMKIYRLWRVFDNKKLMAVRVKSSVVYGSVAAIVGMSLALAAVWVTASPPTEEQVTVASSLNMCLLSNHDLTFQLMMAGYLGTLLLVTAYLTFRLEKLVPMGFPVFQRDVQSCSRVVYHTCTLGMGVSIAMFSLANLLNRRTMLLLEAFVPLYFVLFALVVMYAPKLMMAYSLPATKSYVNSSSGSKQGGGGSTMFSNNTSAATNNNTTVESFIGPTSGIADSSQLRVVVDKDSQTLLEGKLSGLQQELDSVDAMVRMLENDLNQEKTRRAAVYAKLSTTAAELMYLRGDSI